MLKRLLSVLLIVALYTGISYQAIAQYPGSGRDFTRAEMGELTTSGGSVTKGLVAYVDSLDTLRLASWEVDILNQVIIGVSTGSFRKIRTSGVVEVPGCLRPGKLYWLGPGGSVIDTLPKEERVYIVEMGRCTEAGKLRLNSPIRAIRREGDG